MSRPGSDGEFAHRGLGQAGGRLAVPVRGRPGSEFRNRRRKSLLAHEYSEKSGRRTLCRHTRPRGAARPVRSAGPRAANLPLQLGGSLRNARIGNASPVAVPRRRLGEQHDRRAAPHCLNDTAMPAHAHPEACTQETLKDDRRAARKPPAERPRDAGRRADSNDKSSERKTSGKPQEGRRRGWRELVRDGRGDAHPSALRMMTAGTCVPSLRR